MKNINTYINREGRRKLKKLQKGLLRSNNYEAYLYVIVIVKPEIGTYFYVGWHSGVINCDYFNSIRNKEMRERIQKDWAKYRNTSEEYILSTGTKHDMCYLEWKLLSDVNAKDNEFYYNSSNGGGEYLKKGCNIHIVTKILQDIKEKKYLVEPMELEDIKKECDKHQIREEVIDRDHAHKLACMIFDNEGRMEDWEPIVIFEDYEGKNGEPNTLGGGCHTIFAANSTSKHFEITPIPTQKLPKSVWGPLSDGDIEGIMLGLNPLNDKPSLPTSELRATQWLVKQYFDKGVPVKSQANMDFLHDVLKFNKHQIRYRMNKAEDEIFEIKETPEDQIIIDYQDSDSKEAKALDKKMKEFEEDGWITMKASTGSSSFWARFIEEKMRKNPEVNKFAFFFFHTSHKNLNNWEKTGGYQETVWHSMNNLKERMPELRIYRHVEDFLKPNKLEKKENAK